MYRKRNARGATRKDNARGKKGERTVNGHGVCVCVWGRGGEPTPKEPRNKIHTGIGGVSRKVSLGVSQTKNHVSYGFKNEI